jgi:hypothetical protein
VFYKTVLCYSVSEVSGRYIEEAKIFLISIINFYYIINKLIILLLIHSNLVLIHNLNTS